ncbi:MAG TPA: hypothetical protein VLA12_13285 [Planctomycetaceae bacterium]|nr:hypothetical protein [Planctomycetaceae bacterium]
MSKSLNKTLVVLGGLAVLGIYATSPEAEARPQFAKGFITNYPKLEEAAKQAKCGLCHEGETKKVRNAYGKALEQGLGDKKNEKDEKAIAAALKKAAEAKSEGGKTFGEMIAAGELPK